MKNVLKKFTLILLLILIAIPCTAQVTSAQENWKLLYNDLNVHERKDYEFVRSTCHMDINSLANLVESTKHDSIDYFSYLFQDPSLPHPKDNLYSRRGVGKNVHRLLNSMGYFVGLMACFPKDENQRHLYTINLLMFDAYGKVATISILGAGGAGIYRGLAFLGRRFAIPPTVNLFKNLGASPSFLTKLPKFMGKAGTWSFNGITLAALGSYLYDVKKERDIMGISTAQKDEDFESLQRNIELYNSILKLRSQAKTPEEIAQVDKSLVKQKEIIVFYLDTIIEEKVLEEKHKETFITFRETLTTKS